MELINVWLTAVCGMPIALAATPRPFPLAPQSDSHSCGVAVMSTMAHYALQGSLFGDWDQSVAYILHRLKWLVSLSDTTGLTVREDEVYNYFLDLDDESEHEFLEGVTSTQSECSLTDCDDVLMLPVTPECGNAGPVSVPKKQKFTAKRNLIQTKLSFPTLSIQEKQALDSKRYHERREEAQMFAEKAQLLKQKKIDDDRTYNRERKRRWRQLNKGRESSSKLAESNTNVAPEPPVMDLTTRQSLSALTRPYSVINSLVARQDALGTSNYKQPLVATHFMNWAHPLVWPTINTVAVNIGRPWSPVLIVRECQRINPVLFAALRPQRISQWRDRRFPDELQWTESHMRAVAAGCHPNTGERSKGIFSQHPEVVKAIGNRLTDLRANGTPLSMATIRGFMFGVIKHDIPEALAVPTTSGRTFRCSDRFIRRFLHNELNWSIRKATRASQKHPGNVKDVLYEAYLRMACVIRDEGVPACCIVNADQTQVEYSPGSQSTWNKRGERQVHVLGMEGKCAFTLLVAASASGEVLPPQAIYTGMSNRSLPSPDSPEYTTIQDLQFLLEFSETDTYWSTFETMISWVSKRLVPFLLHQILTNNLPPSQKCILLIDCWSVHKSARFREWMTSNYPWIILLYVPGGCTGLFQPCDVGLQRILKKAIQDTSHNDIVKETLQALESGTAPQAVLNDRTIGTLRNRSVNWILQGYRAINSPDIVKKVCSKSFKETLS